MINPVLTEVSGEQDGPEGCLSVLGIAAETRRAARAVVAGVDLDRNPVTVTGEHELARCLQHETGHLAGELYIDRLAADERRRVLRLLRQQVPMPDAGDPAAWQPQPIR